MPIRKVKGGWKWGSKGRVYATRHGAEVQARAAYANGYRGDRYGKERADNSDSYVIPASYLFYAKRPEEPNGFVCANCAFLGLDGHHCENPLYQKYQGTRELPLPADEGCCMAYSQSDEKEQEPVLDPSPE